MLRRSEGADARAWIVLAGLTGCVMVSDEPPAVRVGGLMNAMARDETIEVFSCQPGYLQVGEGASTWCIDPNSGGGSSGADISGPEPTNPRPGGGQQIIVDPLPTTAPPSNVCGTATLNPNYGKPGVDLQCAECKRQCAERFPTPSCTLLGGVLLGPSDPALEPPLDLPAEDLPAEDLPEITPGPSMNPIDPDLEPPPDLPAEDPPAEDLPEIIPGPSMNPIDPELEPPPDLPDAGAPAEPFAPAWLDDCRRATASVQVDRDTCHILDGCNKLCDRCLWPLPSQPPTTL